MTRSTVTSLTISPKGERARGLDLRLLAIFGYSALTRAIALVHSRRVLLGPGLLCATRLASNIGAGSTVGASGLAYRDGLAACWWVGAAGVGSLALGSAACSRPASPLAGRPRGCSRHP